MLPADAPTSIGLVEEPRFHHTGLLAWAKANVTFGSIASELTHACNATTAGLIRKQTCFRVFAQRTT
jgi:hypothetical protein